MSFPYNPNIPAANNAPTNDQDPMQKNFNSINDWVAVDHVGFTTNGGTHNRVTFNGFNVPPTPASTNSVLYTGAGTAKPASPQAFWQNQDAVFQAFPIRAWAVVTEAGAINTSQSYNILSASRASTGVYSISLNTNSVSSGVFAVVGASSRNSGGFATVWNYLITGATTFSVYIAQPENTANGRNAPFSFIVLQI
jgi:hypothetical protein